MITLDIKKKNKRKMTKVNLFSTKHQSFIQLIQICINISHNHIWFLVLCFLKKVLMILDIPSSFWKRKKMHFCLS